MVSANPTGPIPVSAARNGAYGDSRRAAARVRRPRRRARVLLQRRGRARWSASARRSRRCGAGRSRPRTATSGEYIARARGASRAIRCRTCCESDRGDARALPHPLRHVDAARARSSSELPELARRHRRRTSATARSGCARPTYGDEQGPRADPLGRARRHADYEAADVAYLRDKLERGFERADLRPRRRPPRLRRAAGTRPSRDARLRRRSASRCCSTSSCT